MLPRPFAPLTPILGLTITLTLLPSYLALPTAVQPVHDDIAIDSPGSSAVHWNHDQEVMSLVPVTQGRASMVEYIHVDGHDAKDDTNVDLPILPTDPSDHSDTFGRDLPAFVLYPAKVLHLNRRLHGPQPRHDASPDLPRRIDLSSLSQELASELVISLGNTGLHKRDFHATILSELEKRKDYVIAQACVIPTSSSVRRSIEGHEIEPRQSTSEPVDYDTCIPLADLIAQVEAAHHLEDVDVVSSAANDTDDTIAKRECVDPICDYSPRDSEVGEHSDELRKTTGWAREMDERSAPAPREEVQNRHDQRQLLADSSSVAQIQTHDVSSLTSLIVYQGSVTDSSSGAILPTTAPTASSSATTTSTSSTTSHASSKFASSSSSSAATNALSTTSPTTKSKSAAGRRISRLSLGAGGGELTGLTTASVGAFAMLMIAGWL